MVRIGIVGIGFMGMMHSYGIWGKQASPGRRVSGARIEAMCSRTRHKLDGDWSMIQGNYGPRGDPNEDLSGIRTYTEIDEIIADPQLDLIHICLHNSFHRDVAVKALQAGKHVLVEKPIAVQPQDADAMLDAAKTSGHHLLVAHVLPFFPEFAWALDAVQSGRFGRVLAVHLKRIISAPSETSDMANLELTGGPGIDLHIHDTHFIQLLCGTPQAVFARGVLANDTYIQYAASQYIFADDGPTVSCTSGAIATPARPFVHGFEIYLEQATLSFESDAVPLTVLHADGNREEVALEAGTPVDAFVDEIQYAVDVIGGSGGSALSGDLARTALQLCWSEAESIRTGQVISIAP